MRAEWQAAHQALVFERKPRLPTEQGLQVAHFLADSDAAGARRARRRPTASAGCGRNRGASQPLAALRAGASGRRRRGPTPLDTGLDPVCALAVRLRIAPRGKARLTFATAASRQRRHPAAR